MEHTPGPWVYDPNYQTVKTMTGQTIAEVYGNGNIDGVLIAAAPDLLKALKAMHNEFMSRMDLVEPCDWTPEEDTAEEAALAAIAKAEQPITKP